MSPTHWNRRRWLALATGAASAIAQTRPPQSAKPKPPARKTLPLEQFEPKSMLHVSESKVPRARFPVIDFHTHLTFAGAESARFPMKPEEVLGVMDRKNIRIMVNLTGGYDKVLEQVIRALPAAHPGRFVVFTQPWYARLNEPDYPKFQAAELSRAYKTGARGLKILKSLGLVIREKGATGALVKIDDPRFDPMWETAGSLKMPVAIHTSDPEAFFLPIDRFNERWEELNAHPDWSFHGKDFPSDRQLQEARLRVVARHPKTNFVALHVALSENLAFVGEALDKYPNLHVEFGARIGELGRQPRASRKFFERYQDRILFGTDAVPHGVQTPQQIFGELLYEIYYRFLETEDEYFDYAPARVPPQGRWKIYGIGLPESILRKVYWSNAARLLGLPETV